MFRLIFSAVKFSISMYRYGGLRFLLNEVKIRLYRRVTHILLMKNLSSYETEFESKEPYYLSLATEKDMDEIVKLSRYETDNGVFDLLSRKWFYELGFHNCYIARTLRNNEICYMQWMISIRDNNSSNPVFKLFYPELADTDIQLDNAYTFKKFRGQQIMPSVMSKLFNIAREKGYQRVITCVQEDNPASLRGCEKVGFYKAARIERLKLLFLDRRRITPIRLLPGSLKQKQLISTNLDISKNSNLK